MVIKQALGRGLSALIPNTSAAKREATPSHAVAIDVSNAGPVNISLALIKPNPSQPRKEFDQTRMQELLDSVKQKGILQPILVRQVGDVYEIIAGERRYRAAKALGWTNIPAIVRNAAAGESLELALIENIQRENLNPIEEAKAYERLIKEFQFTQEAIAGAVGKDRSSVANSVRLLNLPAKIQDRILKNQLSFGHAKVLLGINDKQRQEWLCEKILKESLSVRQAEELAKEGLLAKTSVTAKAKTQDPEHRLLIEELQRLLGTRVRLQPRGKGGRLEIEYYSNEDLERILGHLGLKKRW